LKPKGELLENGREKVGARKEKQLSLTPLKGVSLAPEKFSWGSRKTQRELLYPRDRALRVQGQQGEKGFCT